MKRANQSRLPTLALVDITEWPQPGKPYDQLRENAPALLARGFRTNIVVFVGPSGLVWGTAIFPADQPHPTQEQLQRIYQSLGSPTPPIAEEMECTESQIINKLRSVTWQ